MTIGKNKVVSLHYRLQLDNDKGELVEETFGSEPLVFLHGAGQMIPDFERNIEGKEEGEKASFGIKSSNAYGDFNPQAVVTLPKSTFVVDGKLATDLLQVGKTIPMSDGQGNKLMGTIKEIKDDEVIVDFNHPMAGQDLYFTVEIQSVREATPSELEHGHAHGPGGHEH